MKIGKEEAAMINCSPSQTLAPPPPLLATPVDLLARARPEDVCTDPFPHLVLHDAVDARLYAELAASFPPVELLTHGSDAGSNRRFHYTAPEILADSRIPPAWRDLAAAHLSASFFLRFVELFRPHLAAVSPELESALGPFDSWRTGVRYRDRHPDADVLLDFMIAVNTPVVGSSSSVRGGHVDLPNKLFTALFYLRAPEDDSTGGDLILYRFRDGVPELRQRSTADSRGESQIPDHLLESVKTVPYGSNVFVIFLNSPLALHGVSPRSVTPHPRRFACAVAQVERDRFGISTYQEGL
jgi:hypothetical protein